MKEVPAHAVEALREGKTVMVGPFQFEWSGSGGFYSCGSEDCCFDSFSTFEETLESMKSEASNQNPARLLPTDCKRTLMKNPSAMNKMAEAFAESLKKHIDDLANMAGMAEYVADSVLVDAQFLDGSVYLKFEKDQYTYQLALKPTVWERIKP